MLALGGKARRGVHVVLTFAVVAAAAVAGTAAPADAAPAAGQSVGPGPSAVFSWGWNQDGENGDGTARRVVPQLDPADAPLPRERAKAPYTAAEIDGYLALADAQPTAARRMRAAGLVCPGAGAGLIRSDLRQVRGSDVACRSGGVLVTVRGARPRAVPVLARYHQRLLASAAFASGNLVTGGTDPARHNVTNPLARSLAGGTGLPPLDTSRLRATWLADCATLIGLPAFMRAAGITCSQRLGDIIATLKPADEATAVAVLGASAR
jgi:integrase